MLEILFSASNKKTFVPGWDSVSRRGTIEGDMVTFAATIDPITGEKVQYGGAFGALLPDQDCYFDLELQEGSPVTAMMIGVGSAGNVADSWVNTPYNRETLVWSWDGGLRGMSTSVAAPESSTPSGVYRFAFDKSASMLYMRRTGSTDQSSIVGVNIWQLLQDGGGRLRPLVIHDWSNDPVHLRLLKIGTGSGGLF